MTDKTLNAAAAARIQARIDARGRKPVAKTVEQAYSVLELALYSEVAQDVSLVDALSHEEVVVVNAIAGYKALNGDKRAIAIQSRVEFNAERAAS